MGSVKLWVINHLSREIWCDWCIYIATFILLYYNNSETNVYKSYLVFYVLFVNNC